MQFSDVLSYTPPANGKLGSITFQGGATFSDLANYLKEQTPQAALRQVPSPSFVTVAGACATGTHGSGIRNQCLAAHVNAVEIVTADGSVVQYDRDRNPEEMRGAVVHAGCLGVTSKMTIEVAPYFDVQIFRHWVPLESLLEHWRGIYAEPEKGHKLLCDSVSTWVDWQKGIAMVTTRHFSPHYDSSLAAAAPHWGDHPWHATAKRWSLLAERGPTLADTAHNVGITLQDGNRVSSVVGGSMAAGAGIREGWILVQIAVGPSAAGAQGFGEGESVTVIENGAGANSQFAALPQTVQRTPIKPDRRPKVILTFENPHVAASQMPANEAWQAPWYDNLPVWPLGQACLPGPECEYGNQAEYFMPAECGIEAVRAAWNVMRNWSFCDQPNAPIIEKGIGIEDPRDLSKTGCCGIGELRCIRGDDDWISTSGARDTLSIHISFSGHPDLLAEVERELPHLEKALEPFAARPHWGKLHSTNFYAPKLKSLYGDKIDKFRALACKLDPTGKFQNSWAKDLLFA